MDGPFYFVLLNEVPCYVSLTQWGAENFRDKVLAHRMKKEILDADLNEKSRNREVREILNFYEEEKKKYRIVLK